MRIYQAQKVVVADGVVADAVGIAGLLCQLHGLVDNLQNIAFLSEGVGQLEDFLSGYIIIVVHFFS